MKKLFFIGLVLCLSLVYCLPAPGKDRAVSNVSCTEIISEGLYFKICEITQDKNTIKLSVQVKNKSMLSQAVYVELIDEKGNKYPPDNKDSIKMFRPLKFNKPITQSLVFSNISDKKIFYVGVYSKDIFKKNKKTLITKLSLKDAKKELQAKS